MVIARILPDARRESACEVDRILEHRNKRIVGLLKKDRKRI